ncbi:MAG TPA: PqqD family protein [Polyangia bacterium]
MHPQARTDDLVVKELGDETLVYDLGRHRAHCLNRTAGLIWRAADGRRNLAEIAREASRSLGATVDEEVVRCALDELARARLVTSYKSAGATRRQVLRGLAFALPAVLTVMAPTSAYAAQSCLGAGKKCDRRKAPPCCPGLSCDCVVHGGTVKCTCA